MACIRSKIDLEENLTAKKFLGCKVFQKELSKGALAIGVSPNGHKIGFMNRKGCIFLHSRVAVGKFAARQTYWIPAMDKMIHSEEDPIDILLKMAPSNGEEE
jgi:hypothetical protein